MAKSFVKWLLGLSGIGTPSDKWNLLFLPGFSLVAFATVVLVKFYRPELGSVKCSIPSEYPLSEDLLNAANAYCDGLTRFYLEPHETLPPIRNDTWRGERAVRSDPKWAMFVLPAAAFLLFCSARWPWSYTVDEQGVDFAKVVKAARYARVEVVHGVWLTAEDFLKEVLAVIASGFDSAASSAAASWYLLYKLYLLAVPAVLMFLVYPAFTGPHFATYGLDVANTLKWQSGWHGVPLYKNADLVF